MELKSTTFLTMRSLKQRLTFTLDPKLEKMSDITTIIFFDVVHLFMKSAYNTMGTTGPQSDAWDL